MGQKFPQYKKYQGLHVFENIMEFQNFTVNTFSVLMNLPEKYTSI